MEIRKIYFNPWNSCSHFQISVRAIYSSGPFIFFFRRLGLGLIVQLWIELSVGQLRLASGFSGAL